MAGRTRHKTAQRLAQLRSALAEGRHADAWAEARRLLATRNPDAGVLGLAGAAAFHVGEVDTAVELLRDAVRRQPKDVDAHMNLGNVLSTTGETDTALEAYERAHELSPDYAEPAFNAGVLLVKLRKHALAVVWFEKALERKPDHTPAAIACAEALRASGNLKGALDILQGLIAREPDNAVARTNAAAVLSGLGDEAAAKAMAEAAIEIDPGLAQAHYNLGVAEQSLGEAASAIERYRRALALQPDNAAAALNQGEALLSTGDVASAETAFQRALDIDPIFAMAAVNLADIALADERPEDALHIIDRFLSRVPGHPSALAFKAFALRDLGQTAEAAELDDPDRFIVSRDIVAPEGYSDPPAFNEALIRHILAHPTLTPSPKAHATRMGRHSGELLSEPMGPMAVFGEQVMAGFDAYRRRFLGEASHPFLDLCPDNVSLSVWAVVMEQDGHQVPHIHPSSWLSGVYYAEVPPTIADTDPEHKGWIEFGSPPDDIHVQCQPPSKRFCPMEGRMFLFPSHFYHRTIPLSGKKRRISIAFDVMKSE